jgi:hypothetical protein
MARYYQPCLKRLLAKVLSGTVLHVDETEVKLRTGKGYVSGSSHFKLYRQ